MMFTTESIVKVAADEMTGKTRRDRVQSRQIKIKGKEGRQISAISGYDTSRKLLVIFALKEEKKNTREIYINKWEKKRFRDHQNDLYISGRKVRDPEMGLFGYKWSVWAHDCTSNERQEAWDESKANISAAIDELFVLYSSCPIMGSMDSCCWQPHDVIYIQPD